MVLAHRVDRIAERHWRRQVGERPLDGKRYATVLKAEPTANGAHALMAMTAVQVRARELNSMAEEIDFNRIVSALSAATAVASSRYRDSQLVEFLGHQLP
jgi:hypothetical protein